jgi:transcriptional regulator with XRE-family HTH domain
MPRYQLTQAREAKELSKAELAELLRCEYKAIIRWEKGTQEPTTKMKKLIRQVLKNTHPDLFKIFDETQAPQPCTDVPISDKLDSSQNTDVPTEEESTDVDPRRRKVTSTIVAGTIAAGTGVALVNSTRILTAPTAEADVYLDVVETSIPTWWEWFNQGNYNKLEFKLSKHVPLLKEIATTRSPFQKKAARFAVEAKIMQALLASSDMQFCEREIYCMEAVEMGELSDDRNLLALAQYWHGDTFTYCYNKPQIAIPLLNDALSNVDGNALVATRIYSDLFIAHAQNHDETNALDFINLAYSTIPSRPIQSPLYRYGAAQLNQKEGKAYLYLAEYLNSRDYAQKAYNLLDKSTNQHVFDNDYLIQAIIRKADALRILGNKGECVTCLTNAYEKASTRERLTQISDVLHRVPSDWKVVKAVKDLTKEVSDALVVARG